MTYPLWPLLSNVPLQSDILLYLFPQTSEITRNLGHHTWGCCNRPHRHVSLHIFHHCRLLLPKFSPFFHLPYLPTMTIYFLISSLIIFSVFFKDSLFLVFFPFYLIVLLTPGNFSLVISEDHLSLSSPTFSKAPVQHIVSTDH